MRTTPIEHGDGSTRPLLRTPEASPLERPDQTNALRQVPVEVHRLSLGDREVRLLRALDLERFVDTVALLRNEETPEPPYWMHLWPGAVALARRVLGSSGVGPGSRVLELGCGLGLPAVSAALRGARVIATDWKREPLRLALESARLNGAALAAAQMDWRAMAVRGCFDLCLGADVAYDAALVPSLVATLAAGLKPGGEAWLADSVNTYRADLIAHLEGKGFRTRTEETLELEEGRRVWVRMVVARRVR